MDIRRITPCMPGAELIEVIDHKSYKGRIGVRLGPVALTFAGTVVFEELDNVNHRARVRAQGTDPKGRGGAHATASFRLEPAPGGSKVLVHTDLSLSGSVAQYGRGVGMIQATAAQLMLHFASNLKAHRAERSARAAERSTAAAKRSARRRIPSSLSGRPAAPPQAARPISGFALIVKVLWEKIRRMFGSGSATS